MMVIMLMLLKMTMMMELLVAVAADSVIFDPPIPSRCTI